MERLLCKQVMTATAWNSELHSNVGQSNPSYYGPQHTFYKRNTKNTGGTVCTGRNRTGPLEIHLGVRPRLEGWSATQSLYSSHMT